MKVSVESLQGYILEEVLAYLVRTTGYDLLVSDQQDQRELARRGSGLVVKGRGADHQVDVLGQLRWVPAFTFPLRLIIEAKFREGRTGIPVVRNAVGTILDINQNMSPTRDPKVAFQKYHYVYAVCSTSGFSGPAQDMALAHQISLIDMSSDEYRDLREKIAQSAKTIVGSRSGVGEEPNVGRANIVSEMRYILKKTLGTWPPEIQQEYDLPQSDDLSSSLSPVVEVAKQYRELFVAMANGPYMLLLKADNPEEFVEYCKQHPIHKVKIGWLKEFSPWVISPSDNQSAYRLSFVLPTRLSDWIFEAAKDARWRASKVKEQLLSALTIVRHEQNQDYLFRLEFDPNSVRPRPPEGSYGQRLDA